MDIGAQASVAMAANIAALVSTGNSARDATALDAINNKLDALLAGASSTPKILQSAVSASPSARVSASAERRQQWGMCAKTGRLLRGMAHVEQSVADIFKTPIGARVMRRTYGSDLYLQKDRRLSPGNVIGIYAAVATALEAWEPRIVIDKVAVESRDDSDGRLMIGLQWRLAGETQEGGEAVRMMRVAA